MDIHALKKKITITDSMIPIPGARFVLRLVTFLLLVGCSRAVISVTPVVTPTVPLANPTLPLATPVVMISTPTLIVTPEVTPTGDEEETGTPTITLSPQPSLTSTYDPAAWESLPVIPTISDTVLNIYKLGQKYHNDPHAFSKVGDCETSSAYFLTDFDLGQNAYNLGPYQDLQSTIDYFAGSFGRTSLAADTGYTASSVLNVIMSDPNQCRPDEIPLDCEYRLHRPSFVLVMFGTNDSANSRSAFEGYMRMIVEDSIRNGVVPVLVTKADNREGDMSINALIAKLAHEYDLPLWNFWAAVQSLPDHGLKEDGMHLTYFPNHFEDPNAMNYAFPLRNLTALQVLEALQKAVSEK
jgi:hypothetical protein